MVEEIFSFAMIWRQAKRKLEVTDWEWKWNCVSNFMLRGKFIRSHVEL